MKICNKYKVIDKKISEYNDIFFNLMNFLLDLS